MLVAMASIWRGSLSFGLVNVQVKVHPATQDNAVSFHQVHAADGGRVRYRRVCEVCGETVEYGDIAKAYESSSGQSIIVTEDDLASLPAGRTREIDVVEFVPSRDVDPILFDRSYYLEPEQLSLRPYVLLRQALERTERTAIAHVALRNKTRLAALRVYKDVIMLQTMLWRDEVRAADFAVLRDVDIEPREQELKMAASLIETLEGDFEPEKYTDKYREELLSLIDRKLTNQEDIIAPADTEQPGLEPTNVVDLISALQASIDKNNERRTGSDDA
jgi:DNA end-binding protein Ku